MSKKVQPDWVKAQRRAFSRWANSHLRHKGLKCEDIVTDFKDGKLLYALMCSLAGEKIKGKLNKKPKIEIHNLENIGITMKYLKSRGVETVGIGARDIYEGNQKLILGLVWTIILRMEIADFSIDGVAGKKGLLLWCQRVTKGYEKCGTNLKNFHRSWSNALGFCAIINHFRPDLLDWDALDRSNPHECARTAFKVADEKLDIAPLLEVEDLCDSAKPDEKIVMTYVAEYFKKFACMEAIEAKIQGIKDSIAVTVKHEKLIGEFEKDSGNFSEWMNTQKGSYSDRDFGTSVESVSEKMEVFSKWATDEKPKHMTTMFGIENHLNSLNTSQQVNSRTPYVPEDSFKVETLNESWDVLDKNQEDYETAMRETLKKYKHCQAYANAFNSKAEQVNKWVTNVSNLIDETASSPKHNVSLSDAIQQCENALSKCEAYKLQRARYNGIIEQLPILSAEVQEPYHEAQPVQERLASVNKSLDDLGENFKEYEHRNRTRLEKENGLKKLLTQYIVDGESFLFSCDSLIDKIKSIVSAESKDACAAQIEDVKNGLERVPALKENLESLRSISQDLHSAQKENEIPDHLLIETLEAKLKELNINLDSKHSELDDVLQAKIKEEENLRSRLQKQHSEQANDYENKATDLKEWIQQKRDQFANIERANFGTNVSDVQGKVDAFSEYRTGDKPVRQADLFSLEGLLGALQTSQLQHKFDVYKPPEDISTSTLKSNWQDMLGGEVTYEEAMRECRDAYERMQRNTSEFESKGKAIKDWINDKNAVFEDRSIPDVRRIEAIEGKLASFQKFGKRRERQQPIVDRLVKLENSIEEPYESKGKCTEDLQDIQAKLSDLNDLANGFNSHFIERLEEEKKHDGKAKDYCERAENFIYLAEEEEDRLRDPVEISSTSQAQEDFDNHNSITAEKISDLEEKFNNLSGTMSEIESVDRVDLVPEPLRIDQLQAKLEKIKRLSDLKGAELEKNLSDLRSAEAEKGEKLQNELSEQANNYDQLASAVRDRISEADKKFDNKNWTSVDDCENALKALKDYRSEDKPTTQQKLFSLEGVIGALHDTQKENKLPLYEPDESLKFDKLKSEWENLLQKEGEYEGDLLDTNNKYGRFKNQVQQFDSDCQRLSDWADRKNKDFGGDVIDDANCPPAAVISDAEKNLAIYQAYENQNKRYKPVAENLPKLIEDVTEPYADANPSKEKLGHINQVLSDLANTADEFKSKNEDLLAREKELADASKKYERDADGVLFDMSLALDTLEAPHALDDSLDAAVSELESHEKFSKENIEPISKKLESLEEPYASLNQHAEGKELIPGNLAVPELKKQYADIVEKNDAVVAELKDNVDRARNRDNTAKEFADGANGFSDWCRQQNEKISKVNGPLEDQIKMMDAIDQDLVTSKEKLDNLQGLSDACSEVGVLLNPYTDYTLQSLQDLSNKLDTAARKTRDNIESALNTNTDSSLSPEKLKELKNLFRKFDETGDGLSFSDFHQCCNAAGLPIDEAKAKKLFKTYDENKDKRIQWPEFKNCMESEFKSGHTKEEILDCFKEVAEGKDTIPDSAVTKYFKNDSVSYDYINGHMKDGNYTKLTDDIFSV